MKTIQVTDEVSAILTNMESKKQSAIIVFFN